MEANYKSLIKAVASHFQSKGFKKKGSYLYLEASDSGNVAFISFITPARQNKSEDTAFTIEIAISSRLLREEFKGVYRSGKVVPQENDHSIRLGFLIGKEQDYWWSINSDNQEVVTEEIIQAIETYGLPEIQKFLSDDSLRDERLRVFDEGERTNITVLNGLALLLKGSGKQSDFDRVCNYTLERYGDRPFGTKTVEDFLLSLRQPHLPGTPGECL